MVSFDRILRQSINPFDSVNFRPGNFWQETQNVNLTVNSIHQEAIEQITEVLSHIDRDRCTRTVLLCGDSGAGKSHLLGRLKQIFHDRAFFAYIGPWVDRRFLWRHILRNTVDSLLKVPEGKQESQLLIWLKGLCVVQQRSILDRLLGDRKRFIRKLREIYPYDLYHANEFFGVLYHLLDPELDLLASDWLRGESLDDEDLKALRVRQMVETEDAAQKILANFGRISVETQPIVLCFDNLDCIAGKPEGHVDFQALLNVNSTIHNDKLKNFFIIISLITNTARESIDRLQPSDLARIDQQIVLKPIDLAQAEALYGTRLYPLHQQADPKPNSPIFPLTRQRIEQHFPGNKTNPRTALELGRKVILEYKTGQASEREDLLAAFKLVWLKAFKRTQSQVTRIRHFSSLDLVQMLKQVLRALQVEGVESQLLSGTRYAPYSLSYQHSSQRVGIVWVEEPNLTHFFYVMQTCQQAIEQNLCQGLQLIRSERLGRERNKGYQLYQKLFTGFPHQHVVPSLDSLYYLATYQNLLNAATVGELVVGNATPNQKELETLLRTSKILEDCNLLQEIKIIHTENNQLSHTETVQEFMLNLLSTQKLVGRKILIENAIAQFPDLEDLQVDGLIDHLEKVDRIHLLDPDAACEEQLIYLKSH